MGTGTASSTSASLASQLGDGGPATAATVSLPHQIFGASSTGLTSAVGASTANNIGDRGRVTSATVKNIIQLFGDSANMFLYLVDFKDYRVRAVRLSTNIITSIAGTGVSIVTYVTGPATSTTLAQPRGLWADQGGRMYIAEFTGHVVKKITPSSLVLTIAGSTAPTASNTQFTLNGDALPRL
eukprot:gene37194-45884_t